MRPPLACDTAATMAGRTSRRAGAVPSLRRPASSGRQRSLSVLLLHGMGGGLSDWNPLTLHLPAHLELWDVKLPWSFTGAPSWAEERRVTQCVSAPLDQLRHRLGKDPDVIIAHSFAANVVLELLAETDLAPAALTVLISPFYRTDESMERTSIIPTLSECYSKLDNAIRARRGPRVSDEFRQIIVRRAVELMGESAALRFHETYQRTPLLQLESLTTQMLLIAGGADIAPVARGTRRLGSRIPQASVAILDGCGHFPMIERAQEAAGLIGTFVSRATSDSRSN